jgi:hypothetical protein
MAVDILIQSGYFDKMSDSDKIARHLDPAMNIEQLVAHYRNRITGFTETEKRLINKMDTQLKALLNSKWKHAAKITFSYVKTRDLENNLPHTHGNIIFVPQAILSFEYNRLFKIIVHEFIHIFQRMQPILTMKLIKDFGYTPQYKRDKLSDYNIRLNPDTNDILYSNDDGFIEIMVYSSLTPSSLLDTYSILYHSDGRVLKTRADSKTEHPYEHIAYVLTDKLIDADNFSVN